MTLCPYCRKDYAPLGIMRHRTACRKRLHPSIDCKCSKCQETKDFLKEKQKKGEIHIAGAEEDLKKLELEK